MANGGKEGEIFFWVLAIIVGLLNVAFFGVIIWGIVKLVNHFT